MIYPECVRSAVEATHAADAAQADDNPELSRHFMAKAAVFAQLAIAEATKPRPGLAASEQSAEEAPIRARRYYVLPGEWVFIPEAGIDVRHRGDNAVTVTTQSTGVMVLPSVDRSWETRPHVEGA